MNFNVECIQKWGETGPFGMGGGGGYNIIYTIGRAQEEYIQQ